MQGILEEDGEADENDDFWMQLTGHGKPIAKHPEDDKTASYTRVLESEIFCNHRQNVIVGALTRRYRSFRCCVTFNRVIRISLSKLFLLETEAKIAFILLSTSLEDILRSSNCNCKSSSPSLAESPEWRTSPNLTNCLVGVLFSCDILTLSWTERV